MRSLPHPKLLLINGLPRSCGVWQPLASNAAGLIVILHTHEVNYFHDHRHTLIPPSQPHQQSSTLLQVLSSSGPRPKGSGTSRLRFGGEWHGRPGRLGGRKQAEAPSRSAATGRRRSARRGPPSEVAMPSRRTTSQFFYHNIITLSAS